MIIRLTSGKFRFVDVLRHSVVIAAAGLFLLN